MTNEERETESAASAAPSPIGYLTSGRHGRLAGLSVTSFAGGLAEALFLILITRVAFAITEGATDFTVIFGITLKVSGAVLVGLLLVGLRVVLAIWSAAQSARLVSDVVATARTRLASAFLRAAWGVQQAERSGQLQELLTTFTDRSARLIGAITSGLSAAFSLLALLGMAIVVDPIGALAVIVGAALLGSVLRPLRTTIKRRANQSSDSGMSFATSLSEVSQLGMEIHVFQVQEETEARVEDLIQENARAEARLTFAQSAVSPVYTGLAYVALLTAVGIVSLSNTTNLTSLGAVMLVMLRSLSYGQAIQSSYGNASASLPYVEALQRKIAVFERGRASRGGAPVGHVGTIAAEAISFAYRDDEPVLRDLTFKIPPNEIVGIVGPSGSGKSTLVQVLLGLRSPTHGRILADGRPIGELSPLEWARKVTFVPQASNIVAGSITENIRFYRSGVTDDAIRRAARLAHIANEIEQLPGGFDHRLGDSSGALSGGQQQRICIARALVEDPDVLILDEPTSALDIQSEHLVRQTISELSAHMTVIIIAHRLSTLDICDRIMVIEGGEMRAFDSPAVLGRSNEFFRRALELSNQQPEDRAIPPSLGR